jgi:Reverse transcriptase (RNA-dependent DNA polymerase)
VACGYSQASGIDFTENYAPVVKGVTFRIILIGITLWNLKAKITDPEIVFLRNNLKAILFIDIPSKMKANNCECLTLQKTIYRFVQSTRQLYVKLVEALKVYRFTGSLVDSCLCVKQSTFGVIIMGILPYNWYGRRYQGSH